MKKLILAASVALIIPFTVSPAEACPCSGKKKQSTASSSCGSKSKASKPTFKASKAKKTKKVKKQPKKS